MNLALVPLYRFWVQVIISLGVLTFCGVGLTTNDKRHETLYSNLIFLVIGYWFPSPGNQIKRNEQLIEHSDTTNVYPPEGSNK